MSPLDKTSGMALQSANARLAAQLGFSDRFQNISDPPSDPPPKPVESSPAKSPELVRAAQLEKAAAFILKSARAETSRQCAMFVRIGFRKAGIIIENTGDAKDYGKKLEDAGFVPIVRLKGGESLPADYVPEPGDVAVMQPYPGGSVEGHMQAFTGAIWASDFRQRDMKDGQQGFWAGPGYRSRQPPSVIYRRQKSQDQPALIAAK